MAPPRKAARASGMQVLRFLPVIAAVLIAGCATTHPDFPPPPPYVQTLEAKGVAPATMQRIEAARVLTFADVLELVKRTCRATRSWPT